MDTLEINNQVRWLKKGDSANVKWTHDSREHNFTGEVTAVSSRHSLLAGSTTLDDGSFDASIMLKWDWDAQTYVVSYMGQVISNEIEHLEVTMYQKVRGFLGA